MQLNIDTIDIRGIAVPANVTPVGYAALIAALDLAVPCPDELYGIGQKHTIKSQDRWKILTPRYAVESTVEAHLDFAFRHEAIDLAVLNALFASISGEIIESWVRAQPSGSHARRAWFLYEWLTGITLNLPDAEKGRYAPILDPDKQFAVTGDTVTRHRIRNNLPGTPDFCPLIRRTEKLNEILAQDLAGEARTIISQTPADLIARAAAFLLLEDSKASYVIEGESPPQNRIQRWGQAIGKAGQIKLSPDEFESLQRIVIEDPRFTHMGWREDGGFVGGRDRHTQNPLPDHISCRPDDIEPLINGLIHYGERSEKGKLDPIAAAAAIAFGFVFIHPFEDGNGRIHRWLFHHILGRAGFNPPGITFPVSAVFLNHIDRYRTVLEHYSQARLGLIEWEVTETQNVHVTNETRDLYRFFDATVQTEFLADSVLETIKDMLPREVRYLNGFDQAKREIDAFLDIPDAKFDLMIGFLRQNRGKFSQRARSKEFEALTDKEADKIEAIYAECLGND